MSRGFISFFWSSSDDSYSEQSLGWTLGGGIEVAYKNTRVDTPEVNPFIPLKMNQMSVGDVQIQNEVTFFPAQYLHTVYVTPSFSQTHIPWPIY